MNMPYKIGNLGDIIKHTWLIETAEYLTGFYRKGPFRYADTFCGFKSYEIEKIYADRLKNRFAELKLSMLQEPFLEKNTYIGSVSIVKALTGPDDRLHIYDTDSNAIKSFEDVPVEVLDLKSGYDVLDSSAPYNLVFLDPYVDFWDEAETVVRKIAGKIAQSTVLLFAPYKKRIITENLIQHIDASGLPFIHAAVHNKVDDLDSTYKYGMLLFPAQSLPDKQFAELAQRLMNQTEKINATLNN